MAKPPWKPWHQAVTLREDLKTGELSLSVFAADLYEVARGTAKRVYQDPREFFALTYPTVNLRDLAKDVCLRLAGKSEKAVRQLELTYGGGKTHSLITLFHLVSAPDRLPDLPAVNEFRSHIGLALPKARIAVLPFDKLDVEKGMEVPAPGGKPRWLKNPWSVLAYQIAGEEGLKLLSASGRAEERDSAPAENLLADLLALPRKEGLATLVLADEVLMYAREKVGLDAAWRPRLVNFFQYLTQAVVKTDRCALVASLLATDPAKADDLGKSITKDLYDIFRREREEGVQPVLKEDVAEVLRRRFFTPDSIRDRNAFRPHVVAALEGVAALDDETKKDRAGAEARFLESFPFHPDLTDVLYAKWRQLEGFQQTRGILRTFALALRDAEPWDDSPLVGPGIFLVDAGHAGISEAARELTSIARYEGVEGKKQEWASILQGEIEKAQRVQMEYPTLKHREVEAGVVATFIHSQPIGHKALTRELMLLLGPTRPDKIDLEKALVRWAKTSWFLDETYAADATADKAPKAWRLGSKPNLKQMHHDACTHVAAEAVEARLIQDIGRHRDLTAGAAAVGAKVHNMPDKPRDIEDDGELHYAVLGPKAASEPGKPSPEARSFLSETTGPANPRTYRNAVVLAVPSPEGLAASRGAVREYLGWESVREQLKNETLDPIRETQLTAHIEGARKRIPEAVEQAYSLCVTVSERDEIVAFKVPGGGEPLFYRIKVDPKSRIRDTAVSADALLPGGPYDLWRKGETARRLKDLAGAFAQFPHLPKMIGRKEIVETLVMGAMEGHFVLRATRPDRSVKTYWREEVDEVARKDASLEVVLPEAAELSEIPASLLAPARLPGLWAGADIAFKELVGYFAGGRKVKVKRQGYEETAPVPKAARGVVDAAVAAAVREGKLWLTAGPASILGEEIPAGLLGDEARLAAPPPAMAAASLLPEALPDAWKGDATTAVALATALSQKAGKNLPWATVRAAIDGAVRARYVELALDSGPWPCDFGGAGKVKLRKPAKAPVVVVPAPAATGALTAEAEVGAAEIQNLAESVADIAKAAVGYGLKFRVRVEIGGSTRPPEKTVAKINDLLAEVSDKLKLE